LRGALRDERERIPRFSRRNHYDPNQLRVPAGHPDGGQWTDTGAAGSVSDLGISPSDLRDGERPQLAQLSRGRYLPDMGEEYDCITKELCPLITKGDRSGIANLLHRCEEDSVRALKVEKFWERTPFPIELKSSAP
jgi:hypothetical protein